MKTYQEGFVSVGFSVKFEVAEMERRLSAEQLAAVMKGIAQVLSASKAGPIAAVPKE